MLTYVLLWILGSVGLGALFAASILLHDWWGARRTERRIRRAQRELEHRRADAIRAWEAEQSVRRPVVTSGDRGA